jgi:hypothetical protein
MAFLVVNDNPVPGAIILIADWKITSDQVLTSMEAISAEAMTSPPEDGRISSPG